MKVLYTIRPWVLLLCSAALVIQPVGARTKAGDRLLKQGQKAELQHDYDAALTAYEQALETDSREPAYLIAEQRVRPLASNTHIENGKKLLAQQKLNEALVQFNKALLTDPSSMIALQMITQTNQMIKQRDRAPGVPVLTPAQQAEEDLEKRIAELQAPPTLRPINNQISSLKMNNQTSRVLYESVGKLAGINVLFDPSGLETQGAGGAGRNNFNLNLTDVTLDEALNYVALVTHTFWKAIGRNAIFVTAESDQKRQEYQDEVVRVFHIQNASTPAEFTEIFNAIRQVGKVQNGVVQVTSQNAVVVRGTPDHMAIIEKLIHDLDRPKAEVLVDVMVMEISKSHITNIGASLQGTTLGGTSAQGIAFPVTPGTSTTSTTSGTATTTTTGSSIPLSALGKLSTNQFSVALPSAVVEAYLTDSSTRILQRPEVRVTDGGKATLKIGSKIPYVSGSLNSAVATPGSIPYATTQFQQIDVGVNIDLQPHVNGPQDVSMHIKVEVSTVTSTETIAGVQQPIIGQRVNEADLRMEDGEASLLGGLTSDSDSLSVAGIPGIANVPVLGYLFGTRSKDRERDDIVIALIPHIVRAPSVNYSDIGVMAGTERVTKVQRAQPEQPVVPAGAAPVAQPPATNPPATQPPTTQPPANLPPLGRVLDVPPGVKPAATMASGAYISDGTPPVSPPQAHIVQPASPPPGPATAQPKSSNSIEIYLAPVDSPTPDTTAGPQAAPDPSPSVAQPQISRNNSFWQKLPVDPNSPLQLTSVVITDASTKQATPSSPSQQQ